MWSCGGRANARRVRRRGRSGGRLLHDRLGPVGGRLHRAALDSCRTHARHHRAGVAVDDAAAGRGSSPAPCASMSDWRREHRRRLLHRFADRDQLCQHAHRPASRDASRPGPDRRGRHVHDTRRHHDRRVIYPVEERSGCDRLPRPVGPSGARPDARSSRLRCPALRSARRWRESGRSERFRVGQ